MSHLSRTKGAGRPSLQKKDPKRKVPVSASLEQGLLWKLEELGISPTELLSAAAQTVETDEHGLTQKDFLKLILDLPINDMSEDQNQRVRKEVMEMSFSPGEDIQDIYDQARYRKRKILKRDM